MTKAIPQTSKLQLGPRREGGQRRGVVLALGTCSELSHMHTCPRGRPGKLATHSAIRCVLFIGEHVMEQGGFEVNA